MDPTYVQSYRDLAMDKLAVLGLRVSTQSYVKNRFVRHTISIVPCYSTKFRHNVSEIYAIAELRFSEDRSYRETIWSPDHHQAHSSTLSFSSNSINNKDKIARSGAQREGRATKPTDPEDQRLGVHIAIRDG